MGCPGPRLRPHIRLAIFGPDGRKATIGLFPLLIFYTIVDNTIIDNSSIHAYDKY